MGAMAAAVAASPEQSCQLFSKFAPQRSSPLQEIKTPKFLALKHDFPKMKDPVQLVYELSKLRESWNTLHPDNLDNFPMPQAFSGSIDRALLALEKIKSPKDLAKEATMTREALVRLRRRGQPFRDTLLALDDATSLIRKKYPSPQDLSDSASETHQLAELLPRSIQAEIQKIWSAVDPKSHSEWINNLRINTLKKMRAYLRSPAGVEFLKTIPDEIANLKEQAQRLETSSGAKNIFDREQVLKKIRQLQVLQSMQAEGVEYFDRHPMAIVDAVRPTVRPTAQEISVALNRQWFFPAGRSPTFEGRAEAFLLGGRPIEVRRTAEFNGHTWANSHDTFARDLGLETSRIGEAIQKMPLQKRLEILNTIDALPTARQQSLARFAVYLASKSGELDRALSDPAALRQVYSSETQGSLPLAEAQWLSQWFQATVLSPLEIQ